MPISKPLGMTVTGLGVREAARFRAGAHRLCPGGKWRIDRNTEPAHGDETRRAYWRCRKAQAAAVYPFRFYVDSGGLVSYGIDQLETVREAASYVDRILRGANPADLPVQLPTKFSLVVNLKTAKGLGLTIPESFLLFADEVIE